MLPGETREVRVRLVDLSSVPLVRRWSVWKPWAVLGAGVVVAAAGTALELRAHKNMNRFDDFVASDPSCAPNGCVESAIPEDVRGSRDTAELQDVVGLSMIGVGAAVAATGVALLILNQPRRAEPERPPPGAVAIAPVIEPGGAGLAVTVTY
jgi:hypothetical protein